MGGCSFSPPRLPPRVQHCPNAAFGKIRQRPPTQPPSRPPLSMCHSELGGGLLEQCATAAGRHRGSTRLLTFSSLLLLPPFAAVKQEVDRNEDMLRSCLRAVDSLARIPAAASSPAFKQFMDTLVLGPALKASSCICGGKLVCAGVGVGMGFVGCALVGVLNCVGWSATLVALALPPCCVVAGGVEAAQLHCAGPRLIKCRLGCLTGGTSRPARPPWQRTRPPLPLPPSLQERYQSVREERKEAEGGDAF